MGTQYVKSCEDCPFAKWRGYHHPVEMVCECPGSTKGAEACELKKITEATVFSRASGWWYKTPPAFCPLLKGVEFKVGKNTEIGT